SRGRRGMTSEPGEASLRPRSAAGGCAPRGWRRQIMPSHLKNRVRARMEKTGESYEQALRHVREQEELASTVREKPLEHRARARVVADTALSIAVVRAEEEDRPEAERLFPDPYASIF